jgi:uncharacterized membrane protein
MAEPESAAAREERDTARVEAFSDGVFAFALTLLVIGIAVPPASEGTRLAAALEGEWPAFAAFVTSFLTVLMIWVNHHNAFRYLARADHRLMFANGVLLFSTALVPFSTALLATHFLGAGLKVATVEYAGNGVLLSLAVVLFWGYASRGRRLLRREVPDEDIRRINRQAYLGPAFTIVAFALAWFVPLVAFGVIFLGSIFYAVNAVAQPSR